MIPAAADRPDPTDGADTDVPALRRVTLDPVVGADPARAFVALATATSPTWLWWTPDGDAVVGAGAAAVIGGDDVLTCATAGGRTQDDPAADDTADGTTDAGRFDAADTLRRRVDAATDGDPLRWFAAFSFAPGAAMPSPWQAFRRNDLVAPLLECRHHGDGHWDVVVTVADGNDDAARDGRDTAARLVAAVTRPSPVPDTTPSTAVRTGAQDDAAWRRAVQRALGHIDAGDADKLVLARSLSVSAARPFDVAAAIARLREHQPSSYVFAFARDGHVFLGASPELLVRSDGDVVESLPLAGTTRATDAPGALTADPKSRREHGLLADAVREALTPFCTSIEADAEPSERTYGAVTHLATRVRGRLDVPVSTTELLASLHPTPAVGAAPRRAAALLADIDGVERGLYAGAVGTVCGDSGEFAVALRCAVVDGTDATLFAGAGIVRGSDPTAEFAETGDKFTTMLDALHGDDPVA